MENFENLINTLEERKLLYTNTPFCKDCDNVKNFDVRYGMLQSDIHQYIETDDNCIILYH